MFLELHHRHHIVCEIEGRGITPPPGQDLVAASWERGREGRERRALAPPVVMSVRQEGRPTPRRGGSEGKRDSKRERWGGWSGWEEIR
jgi:hypothetical protein